MKRLVRLVMGTVVGVTALGMAAPAVAAISPRLSVTTTNAGGANVIISGGVTNSAEDPFAKIQIYMPTGFGLNAPAGGATVGTVSGRALTGTDRTQEQSFTGKIVAIAPTDPAVAYENANCDSVAHAAAWMMQLTATDGVANIPIFVDRTGGSETRFGPYKLVICLRSPDLEEDDPNRAPIGIKPDSFVLTLTGFRVPTAAGNYRWRSLWTPYTPGTATQNAAGTVEAQSLVRIPAGQLTLSARKGPGRTQVRLSGKLTLRGKVARRYPVGIVHGSTRTRLVGMASTRTDNAGSYLVSSRLTKATYYQARVTIARQDLGAGGCVASFGPGIRCVYATIGGARLVSRLIYVQP
jgi:hypothetical protein